MEEHQMTDGEMMIEKDDGDNNQLTTRMAIEKKLQRYASSFSMHALSKIVGGQSTKMESIFWCVILFGVCLVLCIVGVCGLVSRYNRFAVYTHIHHVIPQENRFPSVTFCEDGFFNDHLATFCGLGQRYWEYEVNRSKVCDWKNIEVKDNITFSRNEYWSNGLFKVTSCYYVGSKREECLSSIYLKTLTRFSHSCFTLNFAGNIATRLHGYISIDFEYNRPAFLDQYPNHQDRMMLLVHDPSINHIVDYTHRKIEVEINKTNEVRYIKTLTKRLVNCTESKENDIFPGSYTRLGCAESQHQIEMFKRCGNNLDYVRDLIPPNIFKKYARDDMTIEEVENCIWKHSDDGVLAQKCPLSCAKYDFCAESKPDYRYQKNDEPGKYKIMIQPTRSDTYQVIEEKLLYHFDWYQILAEIGGLAAITIGASLISIVEVVAYIVLRIIKKFV